MNRNKIIFFIAPFILKVLEPIVNFLQKYDGKIKLQEWGTGWIPLGDKGCFDIQSVHVIPTSEALSFYEHGYHKTGD